MKNNYRIVSCNCKHGIKLTEKGKPYLDFAPSPKKCPQCGKDLVVKYISDEERENVKRILERIHIELDTLRPFRRQSIPGFNEKWKEKQAKRREVENYYNLIK